MFAEDREWSVTLVLKFYSGRPIGGDVSCLKPDLVAHMEVVRRQSLPVIGSLHILDCLPQRCLLNFDIVRKGQLVSQIGLAVVSEDPEKVLNFLFEPFSLAVGLGAIRSPGITGYSELRRGLSHEGPYEVRGAVTDSIKR